MLLEMFVVDVIQLFRDGSEQSCAKAATEVSLVTCPPNFIRQGTRIRKIVFSYEMLYQICLPCVARRFPGFQDPFAHRARPYCFMLFHVSLPAIAGIK